MLFSISDSFLPVLFLTIAASDVQVVGTDGTYLLYHGLQEARHVAASSPEGAATPPARQGELKQAGHSR